MTKCIYSLEQGSVWEYAKRRLSQSRFTYSRHLTTTSFPRDSVPITGCFESGHFVPDSRQQPTFTPPQTLPDDTAAKMIWTIQGTEFHLPIDEVVYALWSGDAIICTDGSVSNDNGTYGLVILTHLNLPEPTIAIRLGGHIPPLPEFLDMDLHQLEAAALLIGMFLIGTIMIDCPCPIRPMPRDAQL